VAYLPEQLKGALANMKSGQRRHVAWTFNHITDVTCAYLDGAEVLCQQQRAGTIGVMDCGMDDPNTAYVGLNHRIPGAIGTDGPVQDWRYYREALSADQVRKLAYESVDGDGKNLRSCALPSEGADTDFVDVNGHDCTWYQETRKTTPNICGAVEVQMKCPLACGAKPACWEGNQDQPSTHYIWNKVMLLTEASPGEGKVCVRDGIDAVKECRKVESNPSTAVTPPGAMEWTEYEHSHMDTQLFTAWNADGNYCDVLEQMLDSTCSFPAPWTQQINTEIKSKGGFTIDFWWKALPGTKIRQSYNKVDTDGMAEITFFSRMSPPTRLATIFFSSDIGTVAQVWGACSISDVENMYSEPPGKFEHGVWYRAAFQVGTRYPADHPAAGSRSMTVFTNTRPAMDFAGWDHCLDDTQDFIQGMILPGGILISPIEITAAPLPAKVMQQRYYESVSNFRVRRGPVVDDRMRTTDAISYERDTYAYPVSLVSPPILLQTRDQKTDVCDNALGSSYQDKVWRDATAGVACEFPYECDEELLNASTALMSCSYEETPTEFFGQTPRKLHGEFQ